MKKTALLLSTIIAFYVLISAGCVAKDPVNDIVIQEIKDGLATEFSEDLAMVKNITLFENLLKVYMTDDYPADRLDKFARALTRLYGERMRANKKLETTYHASFFQNKKVDEKMQMKEIAECIFNNSSDKVTVKILGLGSGKYDVK
jgi:hypothetical protein